MIINLKRTYLMAFDKEMSGTIAMRALFKQPSLDAVPGVDDFLFIPELPDAAILVSSVGTATLAEGVRAIFPNRLFVLSAVKGHGEPANRRRACQWRKPQCPAPLRSPDSFQDWLEVVRRVRLEVRAVRHIPRGDCIEIRPRLKREAVEARMIERAPSIAKLLSQPRESGKDDAAEGIPCLCPASSSIPQAPVRRATSNSGRRRHGLRMAGQEGDW